MDAKYYTVEEGSTIVTLNSDYVSSLSVGKYTIGIVSVNGTATAAFEIEAKQQITEPGSDPQTPQTGENSMAFRWITLFLVSGAAAAGAVVYSRKKNALKNNV